MEWRLFPFMGRVHPWLKRTSFPASPCMYPRLCCIDALLLTHTLQSVASSAP